MYKRIKLLFIFVTFTYFNVFSITRYWVGGSGTWDGSTTTNWSTTSGGLGGASAPTSAIDVIFDASSFTAGSQTVTVSSGVCKTMNWTGVTNSPILSISSILDVYGSVTFISAMTLSGSSTIYFNASGNLATNGLSLGATINVWTGTLTLLDNVTTTKSFNGSSAGSIASGGFTLSSTSNITNSGSGAFNFSTSTINCTSITNSGSGSISFNGSVTASSSTTVSSGTLNLNSSTLNTTSITVSGGTLNLGTSSTTTTPYLNVTSGTINFGTTTNLNLTGSSSNELSISAAATVTTGTPTITFTGVNNSGNSPVEIYLGTKTVYNLSFSTGTYSISFFDGGTINSITLSSKSWAIFESTKTFIFSTSFNTTTSCNSYTLISSSTPGITSTIAFPATAISYIQMKDITHSGATKTCTSCVNSGTNTNFNFSSVYIAQTLYWRGTGTGDGNWGTGTNWTANSDGTSSGNTCVPTIVDAVIFDANSFDAVSKTLAIDQRITAASINFTSTLNSPAITNVNSNDIIVTGNLTLTSIIGTITNAGAVYFIGSSPQQITCGNKKLSTGTTYFNNPTTIYSQDDGYYGTVFIKTGTFEARNSGLSSTFNTYFSGDWYLTGAFNPGSSTSKYVIFNGTASNQYIYSNTTFTI